MAQNPRCDNVTFLIGPTLWPKTRFVMLSHSLLGQLYGPQRDSVTLSHSLLGQLYGTNRASVTLSHSLLGQVYGPNRDSATLSHSLLGQLYGPKYRLQNALQRQKIAFFQMVWRDNAIGIIYSGTVNFMAQIVTKNCSKSAIGSRNCSKTVQIENETVSNSLLGQLYGPNRDNVTLSHSLLGQLHGPEYTLTNAWQR